MGWATSLTPRASIAALDDLLTAVDAYLDDPSNAAMDNLITARDKARRVQRNTDTTVDL